MISKRQAMSFFIAMTLCGQALAAAIPAFPAEFYGDITVDGTPAPPGTVVVALIDGEERGRITTTAEGTYGGPETFDSRLIVRGTDEETGIDIVFEINGVRAEESTPFAPGETGRMDLSASGSATENVTPAETGAADQSTSIETSRTTTPLTPTATESTTVPQTEITEAGTATTLQVSTAETTAPASSPGTMPAVTPSLSPLWGVILAMGLIIIILLVLLARRR